MERSSELDTQSPLRKVTLTGTAEQILHGKGLLEEKVTEEASFAARKGATYKSRSSSIPDYQQEKGTSWNCKLVIVNLYFCVRSYKIYVKIIHFNHKVFFFKFFWFSYFIFCYGKF